MEKLRQALQAQYTADWQPTFTAVLEALAEIGYGQPKQVALVEQTLDLRGLWPQTLTVDGQAVTSADLWPRLTATATIEVVPAVGKPADWLVRKLLRTYTTALRDPAQLPASLVPQWPYVRALYNHLQAYAAVIHQCHLREDQEARALQLHGPVAEETSRMLAAAGVDWQVAAMITPWSQAFSQAAHMEDLVIALAQPRQGHAEAGLPKDVLDRARQLRRRHWPQTPTPAFTKQPPVLEQLAGRPADFTVFDLEFSSGNKQEGQFATEIGAIKVRQGKIVDTFNCFVQVPRGKRLNRRSQALTGIHAGMLARFGWPAEVALSEFQNFIGADPVLGFAVKGGDLLVMQRQFGLYATPGRLLDVSTLAKAGGPMPGLPDVGLAKYRGYLGLDILAHGAVYDAVTTYALYAYLQGQPLAPSELMAEFNQVFAATSLKH